MNDVNVSLERLLNALAATERPVRSHLRPGLSAQEIERRCQTAGIILPPELLHLYQFCDGVDPSGLLMNEYSLVSYFFLTPLDGALRDYHFIQEEAKYDEEVNANWFPFLDGEGDQYVLDMEAARQGKPAILWRLREFWPDVVYSSLTTMFDTLADCYQQGAYTAPNAPAKNDNLRIAQISAAHNPDIPYWEKQLRQLNG